MKELTLRQTDVVLLRRSGATLQYIAEKLGVSRERVSQIIKASERKLAAGTHCLFSREKVKGL